jgi:transposase
MVSYSKAAVERAMKVQEVILRAMAKKITWWQAAEIIGISDRSMRRWRERYEEFGYDGLLDRRRGKPSVKRVPVATVEQVLGLYREKYFDLNVRHFHEKLGCGCRRHDPASSRRKCVVEFVHQLEQYSPSTHLLPWRNLIV